MGLITVGIGDAQLSRDPADTIVTHALGSCIAVAIHDPSAGIAGLLHFLLPDSKSSPHKAMTHPCLFADTGIPALFHSAYAHGAQKSRLTVRVVGGAQVMDAEGIFNIGKQNYLACRRILWGAGVLIGAEEVGGTISRTVHLQVGDGRLEWASCGGPKRDLAIRSRTAPVAARRAAGQTDPSVYAQVAVCREYLNNRAAGAALQTSAEVPLGARAGAPWCAECIRGNSGPCPALHLNRDLLPAERARMCNEFLGKGGR